MKKILLILLLIPFLTDGQMDKKKIFLINSSTGESNPPLVWDGLVENVTPNVITLHIHDASDLDTQVPANTAWTISGVDSDPIITAQVVDGIAKTIELTLSANITDQDIPLLNYVYPGGTGIRDIYGNYLASFSNLAITNNTGELPVFAGNANLQWLFTTSGFSGTSTIEDRSSNNNDGLLVKSHALTSDGTTVLTFSSLTGITITSWEGTSTLTKSGNTITTTSGTFYNILLSNGTRLPCAEGSGSIAYDAVNSLNATISGTLNWTATQDTYHYNILNGFSHLGRMDAINQYVTLTSNILFSTGKFSIKVIYAPDNIATTQDLLGTATTANQFAIGSSAGAITGTLRLASGTTYALTCASTAAAVGYANNTFATIIFTRDALGVVTATLNGFTLLINGAASVTDAGSTTISQLMRTSTSNSNIGILKEVEILDHSTASLIGTKYNADNNFLGTLQGGFTLRKYPKPQGGDASNRNVSGTWHNGAETRFKPNPSGNAALQTAKGYTSSTELSFADMATTTNPTFCNTLNPIRRRNFATWTNALAYEDELVANNFVGKTTININNVTGWSSANRLAYTAGSSYNATTAMTVKVVVKPVFITTSMVIFGKTNAVGGNGWAVELLANAAGSDLSLRVRDGSNAVKNSRYVAFSEKEDDISIYHFVIRDGFMYSYRNGHKENTAVAITGITTSTDDLIIGALSGGSAFTGGILAAALYESKGMSDNEVEASYQATKNNVYVQEDGITLLFGSESGNANWIDRVGGTVTMTKSGTLTVASITQAFNYRWRPEDWPSTTTPSGLTTLTTPTIRIDGDSRVVGGFSENGVGFRQGLYDLIQLDPDISGATFIGSQGTAPIQHYGFNGKTSGTLLSEPPGILISNGTYPADIIVNFIGTNAMTTETLFNNELADWETLMFSYKRDIPNVRFVVVGETEHNDAIRRARSQDLMYNKMNQIATLREKGYNITFVNLWRTLKIQDGDFIDVVHPNNQGNAKIDDPLLTAIRLSTNH